MLLDERMLLGESEILATVEAVVAVSVEVGLPCTRITGRA
jgi:hypothetical protein